MQNTYGNIHYEMGKRIKFNHSMNSLNAATFVLSLNLDNHILRSTWREVNHKLEDVIINEFVSTN